MLRVLANSIAKSRSILHSSRATYIRGYWPEPITQQTLAKFLADINYFEEPMQYTNVGLKPEQQFQQHRVPAKSFADQPKEVPELKVDDVDSILDILSQDVSPPELNYDDVRLQGSQLVNLAVASGIYRDLFGTYEPDREYISFTKEQAERLDKLVPYYWITDQPFARMKRHFKEPEPLQYFHPLIGISARFVNVESEGPEDSSLSSHISYYGNILPASEALVKPSITIDGKLLHQDQSARFISESEYNNWAPGTVQAVNFDKSQQKKFSVILLNLDGLSEESATLHWMLTNIDPSTQDSTTSFEETCGYLPVHGIRGFGYSRYVFIVLQHDSNIDIKLEQLSDGSLKSRKFNMNDFLKKYKSINMTPVGLSWFQTQWDASSNKVFHEHLNMTAPVYEHVQAKCQLPPKMNYPGRVPFNIFLDSERDKKETNEIVLLERLKEVDPFDYKDQYVPPKVPPTVFTDENIPSWMAPVMFKKKNKIGIWRGLRPTSAILPLENNADLDHPLRPIESSMKNPPNYHNRYFGRLKSRRLKENPLKKPVNELTTVFVDPDHEIHMDSVKKLLDKSDVGSKSTNK